MISNSIENHKKLYMKDSQPGHEANVKPLPPNAVTNTNQF
jgi:hypothetical protein